MMASTVKNGNDRLRKGNRHRRFRYGLNPKKARIFVARESGTEKVANGKQHSVRFIPTGMKGLPQNVLLNFRLEIPKNNLTIYLPSGIFGMFGLVVSP